MEAREKAIIGIIESYQEQWKSPEEGMTEPTLKGLEFKKRYLEIDQKMQKNVWCTFFQRIHGDAYHDLFKQIIKKREVFHPNDGEGFLFSPHGWNSGVDIMALSLDRKESHIPKLMSERSSYLLAHLEEEQNHLLKKEVDEFLGEMTSASTSEKEIYIEAVEKEVHEVNALYTPTVQKVINLERLIGEYLNEGCFTDMETACFEKKGELTKEIASAEAAFEKLGINLKQAIGQFTVETDRQEKALEVTEAWSKQHKLSQERFEGQVIQIIKGRARGEGVLISKWNYLALHNVLTTYRTILEPAKFDEKEDL
jgi:hypothetical protein